jgi:hypothetical protein
MTSTFRLICNDTPTPAGAVACLLVDEPLTVRVDFGEPGDVALAAEPLEAARAPEHAELVVTGSSVTGFTKPGAYQLKVTFVTGQFRWLDVFVFEARCLELVSAERPLAERRQVLRNLAQDPARRVGTFASLTGAGLNLAPFGA